MVFKLQTYKIRMSDNQNYITSIQLYIYKFKNILQCFVYIFTIFPTFMKIISSRQKGHQIRQNIPVLKQIDYKSQGNLINRKETPDVVVPKGEVHIYLQGIFIFTRK